MRADREEDQEDRRMGEGEGSTVDGRGEPDREGERRCEKEREAQRLLSA